MDNYVAIPTLNEAWQRQLGTIMANGLDVSPRGMMTKELPQKTLVFDMNHPVITFPARKLGYRFLAAEAWWILSGRDDVASIAPYSKEISQFSDDGVTFFGAYGPPIVDQLDYVVKALVRDEDTRQAVLTTWRPNPPETKDVPCTIAFSFMLRDGVLNTHVFMRSSDNWLGIPYDAFNFTMVTCDVLSRLNQELVGTSRPVYRLGTMHLTAASSHIYERNFNDVQNILAAEVPERSAKVPDHLIGCGQRGAYTLLQHLTYLKDVTDPLENQWRWWNRKPSHV
jgi:hypothetical protein